MNRHRTFVLLAALSLSTLGLVGCSQGSSPTEPGLTDLDEPVATTSSLTAVSEEARGHGRGGDDPAGDDRGGRGRGADDQPGDDRRGGRNKPPRAPRAGQEFAGSVTVVNGQT
ncbi:MAG TPA: hypothetical protein VJG13_10855, partial [Thermoanaerobaculia bacterium]|nr:hypothetical protein [Thermoanaerobaculia bacterium]